MIYFKHCVNRYLNIQITLKITFTSEKIFSSGTTTLEILQEHLNINIFLDLYFPSNANVSVQIVQIY